MHRVSTIRICLLSVLLSWSAVSVSAQAAESPLTPRGAFFVRLHPSATTLTATYGAGSGDEHPLGSGFEVAALGTAAVPSLVPVAGRISALAGTVGSPSLVLGRTVARFSADERAVPIQLSYGVLDRLTLGVTVPLIRKRLETLYRLTPDGAELGLSPFTTEPAAVSAFLRGAGVSLDATRARVRAHCLAEGNADPGCVSGQALLGEAEFFLSELDAVYTAAPIFPLGQSEAAVGITRRWNDLSTSFGTWGVQSPNTLPLASEPIDQETFQSLVVAPAWPANGFPLETPDAVLGLGDVEINAAVGILMPDPPTGDPAAPSRTDIYLAGTGTIRFATGSPDSLRIVSPIDPPRGVSGWSGGAVLNILFAGPLRRLALLSVLEAGWNGSREMTLLAPVLERAFHPGEARAEVLWSPGRHVRASVMPSVEVAPGLSIGAGWHFLRREPDEFELLGDGSGPPITAPAAANTRHRVGLQLRYAALQPPLLGGVPFPFEVLFRGSKSVAGTTGATVETRAEAMVRFRIRE